MNQSQKEHAIYTGLWLILAFFFGFFISAVLGFFSITEIFSGLDKLLVCGK